MFAINTGVPKYIQIPTEIKGKADSNIITRGDFNTPLTSMDRLSRQKVNKETLTFNDTLDQVDLIRRFHPKTSKYTFFSSAYGTFSRIDHMLGHKTSPSD